ncbi:MAG: hypothetical protein BAJALOKI1v1_750009 [Promethearchaeota archaeon]|nr:MAG: hypothetical protein BAJALOKI1v1_750009 [Candidatus Lokiarchaeota archaeon]
MTEAEYKTLKEELIPLTKKMPKDITLDDVMYHLYVIQMILRGLEASKQGYIFIHEQVTREAKKCLR